MKYILQSKEKVNKNIDKLEKRKFSNKRNIRKRIYDDYINEEENNIKKANIISSAMAKESDIKNLYSNICSFDSDKKREKINSEKVNIFVKNEVKKI